MVSAHFLKYVYLYISLRNLNLYEDSNIFVNFLSKRTNSNMMHGIRGQFTGLNFQLESLILAQNERWRQA